MGLAYPMQKFQDWVTQQWVILSGKKINPDDFSWLMGPFGSLNGIGENLIHQLAEKEHLLIERNSPSQGLIPSINQLNLPATELSRLSQQVVSFYEKTAQYNLDFSVKWNPGFKFFGILINKLFSNRISQLNIPTGNIENVESLKSEIITLTDPVSGIIKYTVWFRSFASSGKVIYSGLYSTCTLPSGKIGVKAVFPLPKGNATVIMLPNVTTEGKLVLDASGQNPGDAGFYFLLNDSKGNYWSKYVRSFRDRLIIGPAKDHIAAEQVLTLWRQKVLTFNYQISLKS